VGKVLRKLYSKSVITSAIAPHKAVVGEWKNYFSEDDLSLFDSIAGDLMAELAYY
jgi:hypothetical protein